MAFLTPDNTFTTPNGIIVKEKMIPGAQRPNKLLNTPGNKPLYITIHNTDDINEAAGTNDAEQYARATFNGNMGDVYVHYYIDETDCWHILPNNEIGYHATDYSNKQGGNWTSLAIEIIMDGSGKSYDTQAEERGAKLAAYLLHQYGLGIDRLKTHRDWYSKKYCPAYILPHWATFKAKVEKYLAELNGQDAAEKPSATPTAGTSGKHYRVQVGYFSVRDNAVALQEKLKKAGYDAIIKEV